MTEVDQSRSPEEKYQALLAEYRTKIGTIGETSSDEIERRRIAGYTYLFTTLFKDIEIEKTSMPPEFRDSVNTALLRCLDEDIQVRYVSSEGDPAYPHGVAIITPKRGKALVEWFGLLGQEPLWMTQPLNKTLGSRVSSGLTSLSRALQIRDFGSKYPELFVQTAPQLVRPKQTPRRKG